MASSRMCDATLMGCAEPRGLRHVPDETDISQGCTINSVQIVDVDRLVILLQETSGEDWEPGTHPGAKAFAVCNGKWACAPFPLGTGNGAFTATTCTAADGRRGSIFINRSSFMNGDRLINLVSAFQFDDADALLDHQLPFSEIVAPLNAVYLDVTLFISGDQQTVLQLTGEKTY